MNTRINSVSFYQKQFMMANQKVIEKMNQTKDFSFPDFPVKMRMIADEEGKVQKVVSDEDCGYFSSVPFFVMDKSALKEGEKKPECDILGVLDKNNNFVSIRKMSAMYEAYGIDIEEYQTKTESIVHEYDLSKMQGAYGLEFAETKVKATLSDDKTYEMDIHLKTGRSYHVKITNWNSGEKMDDDTFKNIVLRAVNITKAKENVLEDITGEKTKHCSTSLFFNTETKEADFTNMITEAVSNITNSFAKSKNKDADLKLIKDYIDKFMMEINSEHKIEKLELHDDKKFDTKEDAIKYVRENYDFNNCTLEEYMEGIGILVKNKVIPIEETFHIAIAYSMRNLPPYEKARITNPIYLKFLDGEKNNWHLVFGEYADEQRSLGNPEGAKNIDKALEHVEEIMTESEV